MITASPAQNRSTALHDLLKRLQIVSVFPRPLMISPSSPCRLLSHYFLSPLTEHMLGICPISPRLPSLTHPALRILSLAPPGVHCLQWPEWRISTYDAGQNAAQMLPPHSAFTLMCFCVQNFIHIFQSICPVVSMSLSLLSVQCTPHKIVIFKLSVEKRPVFFVV